MSNNNGTTAAAAITIERILDCNVRVREGRNGRIYETSGKRVQWLVLVDGAIESEHDTKREALARAERLRVPPPAPAADPEACPGCGCTPGDGRTEGCEDPDGCGYFGLDDSNDPRNLAEDYPGQRITGPDDEALREAERLAACARAQESSKGGYVQHVNCVAGGYTVSDWYDCDSTVASFENGRAL